MQKSAAQKTQRRREEISFDFSISQVEFSTIPGSRFRITSNPDAENNIALKVEKMKSSQQWQLEIKDLTKHGPSGFPKGAIMKAFKQSLERLARPEESDDEVALKSESKEEFKENDPYVEAVLEDEGAFVLTLSLPIMGFPVDFEFKLLPLAREHIDILETALRDAEDEILRLKTKLKSSTSNPFISLRTTNYTANTNVNWNVLEHNSAPAIFVRSENQLTVQVKAAGFYHVNVRITSSDSGGAREVRVMKNNQVIANSCNGFNTGHNGSVHINDILQLNMNDEIYVFFVSNRNMTEIQTLHQFWIMKIA